MYPSSDDVDAFSRNFTVDYLSRLDELRAKVHGEKLFRDFSEFWGNFPVSGSDNTGDYKLDGLKCDLEGMNGMMSTLLRIASVYSASSRIKAKVNAAVGEDVWAAPMKLKAYIDDALQRFVLTRDLLASEVDSFLDAVVGTMSMYGITLSVPKLYFGKDYLVFLDKAYAKGTLIRGPVKAMSRFSDQQAKYDLSMPERMAMIGSLFTPTAKQGTDPDRAYKCPTRTFSR